MYNTFLKLTPRTTKFTLVSFNCHVLILMPLIDISNQLYFFPLIATSKIKLSYTIICIQLYIFNLLLIHGQDFCISQWQTKFFKSFVMTMFFLNFPGPPQFKDRSKLNEWIARPAQAYVDFECDVCGSPEPNVTWYFKDRRITLGVSGPAKVGHTPLSLDQLQEILSEIQWKFLHIHLLNTQCIAKSNPMWIRKFIKLIDIIGSF